MNVFTHSAINEVKQMAIAEKISIWGEVRIITP
jgi:hypothetical protein